MFSFAVAAAGLVTTNHPDFAGLHAEPPNTHGRQPAGTSDSQPSAPSTEQNANNATRARAQANYQRDRLMNPSHLESQTSNSATQNAVQGNHAGNRLHIENQIIDNMLAGIFPAPVEGQFVLFTNEGLERLVAAPEMMTSNEGLEVKALAEAELAKRSAAS